MMAAGSSQSCQSRQNVPPTSSNQRVETRRSSSQSRPSGLTSTDSHRPQVGGRTTHTLPHVRSNTIYSDPHIRTQHTAPRGLSNRTGQSSQSLSRTGQSSQSPSRTGQSSQSTNRTGQSSQPTSRTGQSSQPTSRKGQSSQPTSRTGQSSQSTSRTGQSSQSPSRTGQSSQSPSRTVQSSQSLSRTGQSAQFVPRTGQSSQTLHRTNQSSQSSRPGLIYGTISGFPQKLSSREPQNTSIQVPHPSSRSDASVTESLASNLVRHNPSRSVGTSTADTGTQPESTLTPGLQTLSSQLGTRSVQRSVQGQTLPSRSRVGSPDTEPVISGSRSVGSLVSTQPTSGNSVSTQQLDVLQNTTGHRHVDDRPSLLNTEALPDILNSHVLPPYSASSTLRTSNQSNNSQAVSPGNSRSRQRPSPGVTTLEGEDKRCCSKERCLRCVTITTTFRWVLVALAMIGVLCVVTGIILGALHMTVGEKYLLLSLLFIGLGVLLVVVVGVGWRCTPSGHEPCHVLFSLGEYRAPPSVTTRVPRQPRSNLWHGGFMYSEFRHRRPPPSYTVSMQEYQRQQIRELSPPDNYSLPSSPPPTYRSRASTVRPGIHITFPPVRGGDYPSSRPPTYRSHAADQRPPLLNSLNQLPSNDSRGPSNDYQVLSNSNQLSGNYSQLPSNTSQLSSNSSHTPINSSRDIIGDTVDVVTTETSALPTECRVVMETQGADDISTLNRQREVVSLLDGMLEDQMTSEVGTSQSDITRSDDVTVTMDTSIDSEPPFQVTGAPGLHVVTITTSETSSIIQNSHVETDRLQTSNCGNSELYADSVVTGSDSSQHRELEGAGDDCVVVQRVAPPAGSGDEQEVSDTPL